MSASDFSFRPEVRSQVVQLCELLKWSNSADHESAPGLNPDLASQRGFYGRIAEAIAILIETETGLPFSTDYDFNFGGYGSWTEDVEHEVARQLGLLASTTPFPVAVCHQPPRMRVDTDGSGCFTVSYWFNNQPRERSFCFGYCAERETTEARNLAYGFRDYINQINRVALDASFGG